MMDTSAERYRRQQRRLQWLTENLAAHVHQKDVHYGSSWKKRGGGQAFAVLSRKWDRIETACEQEDGDYNIFRVFENDKRSESILDDCLDLAGYMLILVEEMLEQEVIKKAFGAYDPLLDEQEEYETKQERDPPMAGGVRAGPPRPIPPKPEVHIRDNRIKSTGQERPFGFDEEEDCAPEDDRSIKHEPE